MPQSTFSLTMQAAASTYGFMQMLTRELSAHRSGFSVVPHPQARDNHGIHWRGLRATIQEPEGAQLYIHTGLVYHPDTRRGIYLEVDRKNNLSIYPAVWEHIRPSPEYDLCKDEPDYLKLFYPDAGLSALMACATLGEQARLWSRYFDACTAALLGASKEGKA